MKNSYRFTEYGFEPEDVFNKISKHMLDFFNRLGMSKAIVGISGGKDSAVVAELAARILGKENVYGVSMPCGVQPDLVDVFSVFQSTKIRNVTVNIEDPFKTILDGIENNVIDVTDTAKINLQPRLRMSVLYAVAQSVNGLVLNTDNLCETVLGYNTLWGDSAGSYAPIKNLTVPEVVELGKWFGLPDYIVDKTPSDGLQPIGDEERMGISYTDVHYVLRFGANSVSAADFANIVKRYRENKFKINMINVPGPEIYPSMIADLD